MLFEGIFPRRLRLTAVSVVMSVIGSVAPAFADSPAELLEKAIYIEETVGNLDDAIEGYEKVLAASKDSVDAAAEAQFRIAACLAKQGKTKQANAAFQAVVDNSPSAAGWVAKAKARLAEGAKLQPVPWGDGDEMHMEMKLATGVPVGYQIFRVVAAAEDGRDVWECQSWQFIAINGMAGHSRTLADRETFAPISCVWEHTMLGEAQAAYRDGSVSIDVQGKDESIELTLEPGEYDNEQAAQAFRRLPLGIGYETTVTVVSPLGGNKVPIELTVPEVETIEVPAGKFECFKLKLSIGQTFWISNDEHRYIVRFEAGGVNANLREVRDATKGETTVDHDRFSATLPESWYTCTPEPSDSDVVKSLILTPNVHVAARFESRPAKGIVLSHKTAKAWLQRALDRYAEKLKDFEVSSEGIVNTTIDGREAVQATFEYEESGKSMKGRRWVVLTDDTAFNLRANMLADDFDKMVTSFDEVVASVKLK